MASADRTEVCYLVGQVGTSASLQAVCSSSFLLLVFMLFPSRWAERCSVDCHPLKSVVQPASLICVVKSWTMGKQRYNGTKKEGTGPSADWQVFISPQRNIYSQKKNKMNKKIWWQLPYYSTCTKITFNGSHANRWFTALCPVVALFTRSSVCTNKPALILCTRSNAGAREKS